MINRDELIKNIVLVVTLLSFCGCQSDKVKIEETLKSNNTINTDNIESTKEIELTQNLNESGMNDVNKKKNELTKDEIVLNYFIETKNIIAQFLKSEKIESAKEICKNYFVTFIDFIFYNGQIKGITFKELTTYAKIKVINFTKEIDELIMTKFPDYKEKVSSESKKLFESVCDLLEDGKDGVENFIIDKIGEGKYSEILSSINSLKEDGKEVFNDIKDSSVELYDSSKQKVKDWYENFREK